MWESPPITGGVKEELVERLRAIGHEVVDFGANELSPDDDYPDFVISLAQFREEARVAGLRRAGRGHGQASRPRLN
jgi:ribose 5-phosphate isomerase B